MTVYTREHTLRITLVVIRIDMYFKLKSDL